MLNRDPTTTRSATFCNRSSADFMISSSLMTEEYQRIVPDYEADRQRLKGRDQEP